jgi:fucose 4-O-acetylase-like acetyltransferase
MALVLLVVVGHSWTLLPHNVLNDHLYDFLYTWHVPAFVLVTGYLSRSFTWESRRMWRLVRTVAIPYVIFECALALFRIYVGGEQLRDMFQDPHWPMWYLSALFFWRLGTPVFKALPTHFAVALAAAISLLGGVVADTTFDFFRICGLLPFFVVGLKAGPGQLQRLREGWARNAAVLVFLGIAIATTWTDTIAQTDWLYYSYGYHMLGVSDLHGIALRGGLLVVGLLGALAFLSWVPRSNGWFTRMGAATLVVYLFHGFVIKGASYAGYSGFAEAHTAVSLVLTTVLAAGLALLLAWPPVARVLHHAVDPFGTAEKHVTEAVRLAEAPAQAEEIAEAVHEAVAEEVVPAR